MTFQAFDTLEEMREAIEVGMVAADAKVQPWQRDLQPSDYFCLDSDRITIYGEILENHPEDEEMIHYYANEGQNLRWCKCYSSVCPDGEYGDTHVSTVKIKIPKVVFEIASNCNWPDIWTIVIAIEQYLEVTDKCNKTE